MPKKPISSDLVGLQFESQELSWTTSDVMLYALGVGARPHTSLDYIYEGKGPKVLPTYAVIPGMSGMGRLLSAVDINLASILHGEQSIELYR
ncbi:MAG: 3-alpha,7-alpha,12-alpha-trihydroxy-5-beta-cholest-24-enoyl-CoA hydratase, partial [Gammaproteobacteria bacterium]|nr:3-alpha,7-alpha,12-alpha-trihydroxy-5-beta-cholest-24-enoyl-CoA hydratase [Gammaproteobacteria bacterium]